MAAVEHYYAEGIGVATTSPHTTWREVAVIPDPGWAAETFYLVLASALVRHYSSADQAQVRLTIGGVTLPDGALSYELTGSVQKAHYGWMYFLSDETGDLALEVSSSGGSEVTVEWGAIFVLNLDDAGLGDVDFFTGEIFTDTATTASFVDQAATVGLTANGADTWLVIGNAMYTGVSGSSNHMMRLNDSVAGALATIDVEGEDATNDVRGYLLMAAVTPSAGSHTFSVQAAHESASCTVLSSRILAINLSACFAQHAVSRDTAQQQPATTPSWTTTRAINPTPGVTGPWLVWGAFGNDVGSLSNDLAARLQINPDGSGLASDPAYGDAAPGADGWDPTDITPFHLFTLATLSAGAARAINLDVQLVAGTTLRVQERTLVAFGLEKPGAGGGVALAGSSGGAAFTSGALSVSGGSVPPTPAGPFDRDLALRVRVDWNRDGEMTGAYDDVSARVTEAEWSLGMYMPYQEMADEARLEMTLVNADRLFTPEYASGPLYGLLAPGAPVLVEMVDGAGNAYTMWRGWVEVIQPSWTPGGDAAPLYARLVALGGMQHLKASAVHLDLLQNVRTDQALASIFSSVSFPPKLVGSWRLGVAGASELGVTTRLTDAGGEYAFDRGRVTLSYVGDNWEDADAHGAILDLVRAERGRFFFARDGRAIFWNRARLQTSTIPALRLVQYQALEYVYGADLYNVVRVRVSPRTLSVTATEVLYELDEPITLRAGQTRTLRASYRQADSDAMVAGMDITPPNTGDGSLAYSGNLSVAFEAGATSAEITLMNLDGESNKSSGEATLTTLIVRGRKLTSYGYQDAQATDTASVVAYGKRMMEVDARLLDRVEDAEMIADWELALHKAPRGQVYAVQLTNRDATAREAQVKRTVGDRLTIAGPQVSHSGDYFIIGETHRVAAGSKHHKTTWRLEPAAPYAGWQLGVAGYSELGSATRLGF